MPGTPVPLVQAPPPGPTVPQLPGIPSTPTPAPSAPPTPPVSPAPTSPPSVLLPPPRTSSPPPSVGLPLPRTLPEAGEDDPVDVPDSAVLLASARNAVRQNDLPLAIERFEQYLRIKADDIEVREELAGIYFRSDRLTEATREYERLIRENSQKAPSFLITLAAIAVRQQKYVVAEARLIDAIGLTSDDKEPGHRRTRFVAASRLAQLYLIQGQYTKAIAAGQKYLAGLTPDDEDVPPEYVELLLDLEKPEEALTFVGPLLEINPEDAKVLTAQVRAHAQLGDRLRAFPAIDGLPAIIPDDIDNRLKLAQDLIRGEDFDLAELVLAQIATVRPQYAPAQIVQAGALIRQYRLGQAKTMIAATRPTSQYQDRDYALTRAGFHEAAGEYIQAKLVYETVLRTNPFDNPTHLAFGGLYAAMSEYEKAKAEYSKVPPDHPSWRPARRGMAAALVSQRRFPEALDILDELMRCAPWDADTAAAYMKALTEAGDCDRAAEVGREYLTRRPPTRSAEVTAHVAFGDVLLDCGTLLEAEQQYAAALKLSHRKSVPAMFGLMQLGMRNGEPCRFPPVGVADQPFDELRVRLDMVELFVGERDDQYALEFATAGLRLDPQNIAALIRVAEAHQRISRQTGDISEAVMAAKGVLMTSPTNNRALTALARSFSIAKDYKAAAGTYQEIIALDQDLTRPKREVARVYYADNEFTAAHNAFMSVSYPDPDAGFRQTLQAVAANAPQLTKAVDGLAVGALPGPQFRLEVDKLLRDCPDPIVSAGLLSAAADYEARMAEIKGATKEDLATTYNGIRPLTAIPLYYDLLDYEPANAGAYFDLGQIYSGRQDTDQALKTYSQLLAVDPQFREAVIASERARAEASPTYTGRIRYEDESGRDGLATMNRFRFSNLFTVPLGDENEFAGIGYSRVAYSPADDTTLDGNILTAVYQQKFPWYDPLLFRGVLNLEQYPDRVSTKPTFDAGLQYNGDGLFIESGLFLENVIANGEALRQDIYRYGARVSANYQHTRRLSFGGLYRYARYSDDNNLNELNLNSAYIFCFAPRQLRLLLSVNNLFYSDQTEFGPFAPDSLVGTVHPYFSPSAFSFYEARLDYTEYCCRDYSRTRTRCITTCNMAWVGTTASTPTTVFGRP